MTGAGISPNCQIANVWLVKKPGRRHSTLPSRPLTAHNWKIGHANFAGRCAADSLELFWGFSFMVGGDSSGATGSQNTMSLTPSPSRSAMAKGMFVSRMSSALNSSIGCSHAALTVAPGEANEPELLQFPG